jgi:DNA-binding response OmpR family regulator
MPSVLILEDDATMLNLLRLFLELENIEAREIRQYQDLESVVAEVEEYQPDLVLLDVQLSQFTGFDVLRRLRNKTTTRQPRVLIMSGLDMSHECLQAGADGFIMKPFMPDDLLANIRQLLGK